MGKYLKFYKKCMGLGHMPTRSKYEGGGLCEFFKHDGLLELVSPSGDDLVNLMNDGLSVVYWGEDASCHAISKETFPINRFTTTRQNIVLILACLANEDFNELKR